MSISTRGAAKLGNDQTDTVANDAITAISRHRFMVSPVGFTTSAWCAGHRSPPNRTTAQIPVGQIDARLTAHDRRSVRKAYAPFSLLLMTADHARPDNESVRVSFITRFNERKET